MFDPELESFKTTIDLRSYAASQGYQLDRKESWNGSAVMRHANGDKIIIKRDADSHYVFFSVRDDADNGSIIDFAKRRLGCSLGAVRKELRPWLSMPSLDIPSHPPLQKVAKDRIRVERAYARMQVARSHPYLENERAIPRDILESGRFAGRIKIDTSRGNAIFPHEDENSLCGFEVKNHNFTSFAAGGTKGLWTSHLRTEDRALVLAESAIDALSYATLFPDQAARYASIGGKMTPKQKELIRSAAAVMPGPAVVIAAVDADTAGTEIAGVIETAVRLTGRSDLRFEQHSPEGNKHKDWNEVLKSRPELSLPCRQEEPTVS
jgi:hypothetical protein